MVTIARTSSSDVDAEGNASNTPTVIYSGRGTWGTPGYRDQLRAQQLGQEVHAVVAMPTTDVRPGDSLNVRGRDHQVVQVVDVRNHIRVFLREGE